MTRATMCELASAAYYMELEPLIDLTCKAIASSIDWSRLPYYFGFKFVFNFIWNHTLNHSLTIALT